MNARELRARRGDVLDQAQALVLAAETEDRNLSEEEQDNYDNFISQADDLAARIERLETIPQPTAAPSSGNGRGQAPAFNRLHGRGDDETRAMAAFFRYGDPGGVSHLRGDPEPGEGRGPAIVIDLPLKELRQGRIPPRPSFGESRAAVDSTINITTDADGGVTVPTGLAPRIAQRMGEIRLTDRLGCQMIPGKGTTVNHVYENADAVIFATTSEQADDLSTNDYERDAPVLAAKAFTLVKKTKKLNITEEVADDNDVNLMEAVANWIGRGIALTHNSALITEAAASGSTLKTYAAAAAIAAGEPEDIVFGDTVGFYLDDDKAVNWVTRPTTFGNIASITGNSRLYAETPGGRFSRELLGYPVFYSNYVTATAASAKDLYFGNWWYMGFREDPKLRVINDPYSEDGVVVIKYSFRIVYGVLIAGALGFGVHPSA